MGFIEREEEKHRELEREKRDRNEERAKELKETQESQDRWRIQQASAREAARIVEEKRRELWTKAKEQFTASGLGVMLKRLVDAKVIDRVKEVFPQTSWEDGDGLYRETVTVSSNFVSHGEYSGVVEKFFGISFDSTGLMSFEYGTYISRHKKIKRSIWERDSSLLEKLLERACKHPITAVIDVHRNIYIPPESSGR